MMEKLIFGRYIPGNSIIHQMDPRSKLLIVFLFVFVVFLANNLCDIWIIGVFTIGLLLFFPKYRFVLITGLKPIFWYYSFYICSSYFFY